VEKPITLGREDVFGFNSLVLNWCIGGCWFILAKWMVGWTGGFVTLCVI
jgi:hypothetical protein